METVANVYLTEHTIGEGGVMPGVSTWDFQLEYAVDTARKTVEQMAELKKVSVLPYPQVWLSAEDQETILSIQYDLSDYAEKAMACFVTGDTPLDDEHWNAFTEKLNELGLEKLIAIWQKAAE